MATLTAAEISSIRREVGTSFPSDLGLQAIYDRVGNAGAVVLEVLDQRLADLIASPADFTVFGEYAQSNSANIIALREQLRRLRSGIEDNHSLVDGGLSLVYAEYRRR